MVRNMVIRHNVKDFGCVVFWIEDTVTGKTWGHSPDGLKVQSYLRAAQQEEFENADTADLPEADTVDLL